MTPEPIVFTMLGIIFFSEGFRVAKQNNLKVHDRKRCHNPSPGNRTENGCGAPRSLIWWRWELSHSILNFSILRYQLCVAKHTIKQHNTLVLYGLGLNCFLNCIYFYLCYACMSPALHACSACSGQKMVPDFLNLRL